MHENTTQLQTYILVWTYQQMLASVVDEVKRICDTCEKQLPFAFKLKHEVKIKSSVIIISLRRRLTELHIQEICIC